MRERCRVFVLVVASRQLSGNDTFLVYRGYQPHGCFLYNCTEKRNRIGNLLGDMVKETAKTPAKAKRGRPRLVGKEQKVLSDNTPVQWRTSSCPEWVKTAISRSLTNESKLDKTKLKEQFKKRRASTTNALFLRAVQMGYATAADGQLRTTGGLIIQGKFTIDALIIESIKQTVLTAYGTKKNFSNKEFKSKWEVEAVTVKWNKNMSKSQPKSYVKGQHTDRSLFNTLRKHHPDSLRHVMLLVLITCKQQVT
jgi:hypothetical protein